MTGRCVNDTSLPLKQNINPCDPNPCLNFGSCNQISNFYLCVCIDPFYGNIKLK